MSEIHRIARRGDPFSLRELLEVGADPNDQSPTDRHTPAMAAAAGNRKINLKILVKFGADLSLQDVRGRTVLSHATHAEAKTLLIELGAEGTPKEQELMARLAAVRAPQLPDFSNDEPKRRAFVEKASQNFALSPEEYVARNRGILVWGLHAVDWKDARYRDWTTAVHTLLMATEGRESAYRKHLEGTELERALRALRRERVRELRGLDLKRLDDLYAQSE